MKNAFKKSAALLLALLMLALCAACGDQSGDGAATTASATAGGEASETVPVETNALEGYGLELRDMTGETLNVWYSTGSVWSPHPLAVTDDEGNCGDIVLEAGYKRNLFLEDTLKLTINYTESGTNPNSTGSDGDLAALRALASSGDIKDFDIVMTGATPAGQLALENFYLDLSGSKYIKSDSAHYESRLNKQLSFFGRQFFAAGFYSIMNTAAIDVTYVNMSIVHDTSGLVVGDLYDLALNRKWTVDKMIELGMPYATLDVNKGDIYSDHYSLILSKNYCQNIYYDLGGSVIEYDAAQNALSASVDSGHNTNVWSFIEQHLNQQKGVSLVSNDKHTEAFMNQAAPFMIVTYNNLFKLAEATFDWAMLPTPLMEEGGEFYAYSDAWNLNFAGIPAQVRDSDKSEYLFEAFMCASYDFVYPAYYENCFGTRYQPDATGSIIFDMMNNSRSICLANIFGMTSAINSTVVSAYSGDGYASALRGISLQLAAKLRQMNEQFK